jgi:hypothetical protein
LDDGDCSDDGGGNNVASAPLVVNLECGDRGDGSAAGG